MDDSSSNNTGNFNGNGTVQDYYNRKGEWSLSTFDVSRRLVASAVYSLPFGRKKQFGANWNRLMDAVLGGWQANGIFSWQTGLPLTLSASNAANIFNPGVRPNNNGASGVLSGSVESRLNRYFNTSVFSQPEPYTFGNVSRTSPDIRTPAARNLDLSLFKNFAVNERLKVEFRAESFNAFNTPVFGGPNNNVSSGSFGVISSQANSPRQMLVRRANSLSSYREIVARGALVDQIISCCRRVSRDQGGFRMERNFMTTPTITRRSILASLAIPLLAQTRQRMNVLFIAADDLNTSLGCYGHPVVMSPNIDKLAAAGVRFDRAYCQFPLCCPTRSSLLTGLRPDTTKVLANAIDFREFLPDVVTLPQLFKNNGWYAAREGKIFHMNVPAEVTLPKYQDPPSWNHSVSPGGPELDTPGQVHNLTPGKVPYPIQWIASESGKGQSDSNAAENALTLLDQHRNEPFFLGLGFVRPHLPFVAPSKYFDMYPLDSIPLPNNPPDDLDDIPEASKAVRPFLWNNMKMDERGIREARRGYYASTSFMDEQLGRVMSGLEKMGLAERTIVVFWGDHGWSLGEHTHWQKMSLMEESTRVPLIIRAPRQRGNGKVCRSLVEFVDLYPTLAELCGIPPPSGLEGQSMVRLLKDPARPFKKAAFMQIAYEDIVGRAVRTDRYHYIKWEGHGGGEELYDHKNDPDEFTNLAKKPGASGLLAEHRRILANGWQASKASS